MNKNEVIILFFLLACLSCRKIEDYFKPPDTTAMAKTIRANIITGYSANVALSFLQGNVPPYATFNRSNDGFPCTTLVTFSMENAADFPYSAGIVSTITIAGLWADGNTGILTILFSDYNSGSSVFSVLGIETIPVIKKEDGTILIAIADMDIALNPDGESLLDLNLSESEISYEYSRLETGSPSDIYVAVEQRAYVIEVDNNNTLLNIADDIYTLTGGGQFASVSGVSADVLQLAMIDVEISPSCLNNPVKGMALIQSVETETGKFPGTGSALLKFHEACDGQTEIIAATGIYLNLNGKSLDFSFN